MRELLVGAGCVLGLLAVLWLLTGMFDSSAGKPAHAMELAQVRAEANAARVEAGQAKADHPPLGKLPACGPSARPGPTDRGTRPVRALD